MKPLWLEMSLKVSSKKLWTHHGVSRLSGSLQSWAASNVTGPTGMVPRPANLGQPLKGLSKINTIQVKRVSNIYFLFIGETDDRDTSARPTMREVGWFQRSRGCCLATQSALKAGPLCPPRGPVQVWEPACSPKRVSL